MDLCFIYFTLLYGKELKMRNVIVYIGGFKLPDRNASAIRVMDNAVLLQKLGYKVIVVGKLDDSQHYTQYDGIECYDILQPSQSKSFKEYTKSIDSIVYIMEKVGLENIYAFIAYNYPAFSLQKLTNFARTQDIIPIADCTEWYGWEGYRIDRNIKRQIDTYYRMYFSAKATGNVICAGSYLQKHFNSQNTVIWPFCVNSEQKRWNIKLESQVNNPRVLIYSGSPGIGMSKDKIDLIIEALYQLHLKGYDFVYKVLGITKSQYLHHFKSHKNLLNKMNNKVLFKGRVPHSEAIESIKAADFSLFIRPNNRVSNAGFPTKVMEAFSMGIPTITNATSDMVKYVKNNENGLIFDDVTKEEITKKLEFALKMSDDKLLDMKHQCIQNNPFDTKNFIDKIDKFLKEAK
jgi:glycosyltransferase involved in cell wall biosynthesis